GASILCSLQYSCSTEHADLHSLPTRRSSDLRVPQRTFGVRMSRTSPDRPRILLGAMSGTSADGVDVAAVEITGRGIAMKARYLAHVEHPYDPNLRQRIFALREGGQTRLDELASLGRGITLAYAVATRELLERMSLRPSQVEGLAAHGQTLYHAPPESIQ